MNVTDAAYATVHDYPGGSEALAPRMGMSAAVLRNKVNPRNDRNYLSIEEADRLIGVTGDPRLIQAFQLNHDELLSPPDSMASLIGLLLSHDAAHGDLSRQIADALADDLVTERELRDILNKWMASQRAGGQLVQKLQAITGKRVTR